MVLRIEVVNMLVTAIAQTTLQQYIQATSALNTCVSNEVLSVFEKKYTPQRGLVFAIMAFLLLPFRVSESVFNLFPLMLSEKNI